MITQRNDDKTVRLVDYLLRLATLRSKLIRKIDEYEKVFWLSSLPHERECFTQAWGRDEEHELDEWLEVQNRREPELPSVPALCKDWVDQKTLRNKGDLPELLSEITRQIQNPDWREGSDQPEFILHIERIEDYPTIQREWDRYIKEKWLPWTELHYVWEKVNKAYSSLFAIYQEQLRLGEEYELVLGLGLLIWQTPTKQPVRRHLVVADAILEFEARLGKFTVRPHTEGAKLRPELDMLNIEDQPARAEEAAKNMLSKAEDDPWQKGHIEGVLQSLVHSINSQGDYYDSLETKSVRASAKPIVEYAPALILRKRSAKGLTETLKRIREQIEQGENIPGEFADLAEVSSNSGREPADAPQELNATFDGEVYFPKPSNDEQRRIVDKIRTANGVLVQGPPGTGKSHTIANLICHLLATGQRTLITAKTPRALQVLEGLVPDELRPLCINLLGSGLEERRSLESSVGGILRKNEEWREDHTEQQRAELEVRLRKLRGEKAKVNRRLRDIRESEIHTQSIAEGAYRGTAARIAEAVNRDRASYDWFLDEIPLEEPCRITEDNLHNILEAVRRFTQEKRRELDLVWPDAMLSSEDFADLVRHEAQAIKEAENSVSEADERITDLLVVNNPAIIEAVRYGLSSFSDARKRLTASTHSWMNDALRDIMGDDSSLWHELLRVTRYVITSIEELVTGADETKIEFSDTTDIRSLHEDVHKLKQHMENGGKLGWGVFRPKPVKKCLYVLKTVKVNGHPCTTIEHFSTIADALYVRIECEKAWGFWAQLSDKTQGPYALQLTALKSLRVALENALALEELIANCREEIGQCSGMVEPVWADSSQVEQLISSCSLASARIRRQLAGKDIQRIEIPISSLAAKSDTHPATKELLSAIRDRNVDRYTQVANRIQDLEEERQRLRKVEKVLRELHDQFPHLAESLEHTCNEPYWEERIRHIGDAWHWAQARYWIADYIHQEDVPALAKRAKQIEDEINGIIAKLASLHAWSFCFSRLKEDHRRHMEAWQQSMRRLGKGTGKHAPRHRREAQGHLNECREAVPAWVMPLHRVWDTVDPTPGMFDVIIVDEASQCGVEALPLFYLSKKILIVGDDKQISPDAVGLPRGAVHRLMEEFLYDFHFKSSFDIESSLFDHGKLRYGTRRITLREHFRCMPEIIRFSNDLCYLDTPLIPLRQYGPNRLPPLEHVFVNGGYREGSNNRAINRPEAEAIVERIEKICSNNRYNDKTMGVVVLQGEAQAALIENQLLERLGAEEMERRRLVCGNPYSFQGDERDIMLLSLVAASNERIGPLTKAADERRFNVAASRARDRMILFHSVTCDDLSSTCLRRRLLAFFENTTPQQIAGIERNELERRAAQDNRSVVKPPPPFESWFEVDVALEILRKKYIVLSQYDVARKRIDLVVEGGQARLAVECDGDNWHGADRYEEDMQRQRQLERCGWEFFRVRESSFYSNKIDALKGLWDALDEKGIYPQDANTFKESSPHEPQEEPTEERYQERESTKPINEFEAEIKVDVEDTVVYIDINNPQSEKQALITYQKSNPEWGYININTPIAQALMGATLGSVVEAKLPKGTVELLIKAIKKPRN
ncbi:AAA domain-containing protein [Dethiosulfatarculus sandiegensis]|uniref:ATPase AAA n=1 Tax=Dethiosulfatarculus sandiegensis TaxID=1429043 RepID=A0A0D2JRJ6_9BACT|nr:AAA domain-containing protein [Dethiosulfatarculus sandiegensis]KIX12115.1 ATPase AAA [Dethiosulfatarculus sandiegensis]